jgi:hypothetical protein
MKSKVIANQTFMSAFVAVGAIVLGAIVFQFQGLIELRLDLSGGQVTIDSRQPTQVK